MPHRAFILIALLASACRTGTDRQAAPSAAVAASPSVPAAVRDTSPGAPRPDLDSALRAGPVPADRVDTALQRTIRTAFFTIGAPLAATVDTGALHPRDITGLRIRGPVLPRSDEGYSDVAYELVVATYRNPGRTPLPRWVDSLRAESNRLVDAPDSLDYISPGNWLRVGADSGLLIDFFCGDCQPWGVYLARDTTVVALAFTGEQTRALSYPEQMWMAMHIADSFRWTR